MAAGPPAGLTPSAPRRAAVLGHPVAHSLSPVLHRAAYSALGLASWRYDAIDVDEVALPAFLDVIGPQWAGLSLTMPLKRVVLPLLDDVSPLARQTGVVNTVVFDYGGGRFGDNTDVAGIAAALEELGAAPGPALLLGAGATAVSALVALRDLKFPHVVVLARDPGRGRALPELGEQLGLPVAVHGWTLGARRIRDAREGVVISTLPGAAASSVLSTFAPLSPAAPLLDVAYDPWPTRLVSAWRAGGSPAIGGFAMLLHQAAEQVRLMTGCPAPLEAMRTAGEAELAQRAAGASRPPDPP